MRFINNRCLHKIVLGFGIFLLVWMNATAQTQSIRILAKSALQQEANSAAAYLLYADYLRNPKEFEDYEITAFYLSLMGEYAKADTLLNRVNDVKDIETLNDSLQFYYFCGRAIVETHRSNYVEALRSISRLPIDSDLTELSGHCYDGLGLFDKAIETYSMLFADDNKDYVHCLIAESYRKSGNYAEAINHFSKALQINPNWAMPYYGLGWSYELSGDDDNALKYYNDGVEADQSYPYLYLMRGELYHKKGITELAEKDFNTVLRLDKKIEDGTCRQYALHFLGRDEEALNWMNFLIDYQPNNPGHYYDKACLCSRMGRFEDAVQAMRQAFEKGYREFAHLNADDDIDLIKSSSEYRALYKKYYAIYLKELEQLKDIL